MAMTVECVIEYEEEKGMGGRKRGGDLGGEGGVVMW